MSQKIVNVLETCQYAKKRQWLVTNSSTTAPARLTGFSVSSLTRNDTTATVTTAAAHNLQTGDYVTLAGADQAQFVGTFRVESVPSGTTFTFAPTTGATVTTATGTITGYGLVYYRRADFLGNKSWQTVNTGDIYLGVSSTNAEQPVLVSSGGSAYEEAAPGAKLGLHDLYLDVATANDGVVVVFH